MLKRVLKYVHIDNKELNFDDFIFIDVLNSTGNYFPFFHTDLQWGTFEKK